MEIYDRYMAICCDIDDLPWHTCPVRACVIRKRFSIPEWVFPDARFYVSPIHGGIYFQYPNRPGTFLLYEADDYYNPGGFRVMVWYEDVIEEKWWDFETAIYSKNLKRNVMFRAVNQPDAFIYVDFLDGIIPNTFGVRIREGGRRSTGRLLTVKNSDDLVSKAHSWWRDFLRRKG